MSTAGVVIYKIRKDGSLDGRWTHEDLQGAIATERAWGGPPGKLAGIYTVEIYTPDKRKLFEGSLTLAQLGAAYKLIWSGTQFIPKRKTATYSGIGVVENGDTLVATFQEDGESGGDVRKEIEQANADFGEAYATGNAASIAEMYTVGARLLPPHASIVDGRKGIEQFWKGVMGGGIKKVELKTVEVEVFGDTVVENGSATLSGDGGVVVDRGKYLVTWKRVDGKWKLHRDCWNSNESQRNP